MKQYIQMISSGIVGGALVLSGFYFLDLRDADKVSEPLSSKMVSINSSPNLTEIL
jgi:hypothetical protein